MVDGDPHAATDASAPWSEPRRRRSTSDANSTDNDETAAKLTATDRPNLTSTDTDDPSVGTRNSTDDEATTVVLENGIPAEVPLEALAGPGLVTNYTDENFDWAAGGEEDEEDEKQRNAKSAKGIVFFLSRNSSYIAWSCIVVFAIILIAVDVAIWVEYRGRETMVSYNLELWFTWAAFMWCISVILQLIVELIPWVIKRIVGFLRPQSTEVLRMRLAYYMALRPFIKLLLVSAWAWGSWAFIQRMVTSPAGIPAYVNVFFSIWEAVFFAALFIFIEKFILQLIVTSFHKKAYGDRIAANDRALKILDRLKKQQKKRTPQDFLRKHIRRNKNLNNDKSASGTPTRSASADDTVPTALQQAATEGGKKTRSIMRSQGDDAGVKSNVRFPSTNMDTLIAIPPLEGRVSDDEKQQVVEEENPKEQQHHHHHPSDFVANLTKRLREVKKGKSDSQRPDEPKPVDSPAPLSRSSTWMSSRPSNEEKSFLNATRDFGINTSAIPGRLLRGGYRKLRGNIINTQSHHNTSVAHGTSHQAKALAKRIYHNIVGYSGRQSIVESDFYPFFRTHEEAAEAFRLFDQDGNGNISKMELRSACVRIYRERKNLARSMRDLSQATGKLDIILLVIFTVIWIVVVCAAFGVNVGTSLMPLWSAFIAASFVFGNSAKDAFESIIFVFVTHPFDAGDRVFIGTENWVVANVGLLVSTFIKWDGSVVYAKNSVLATQYIINVRRTGRTGETMDLNIAFSTPSWKIHRLRDHMIEWANQFPNLYTVNSTTANIISFENQNRITITFYVEHTQNWMDMGGRWLRHNNFMFELKEECERLGIDYVLPSQPYQNSKNEEGPPEIYNMGSRSSYGQEGLHLRRGYEYEDDDVRGAPGAAAGASVTTAPGGNAGAQAAAASTLMFATNM